MTTKPFLSFECRECGRRGYVPASMIPQGENMTAIDLETDALADAAIQPAPPEATELARGGQWA